MGVKMVPLLLKKHYKNNYAGEIAGFPEAEAAHIIANGGGVPHVPEGEKAAAAPAPEKTEGEAPKGDGKAKK